MQEKVRDLRKELGRMRWQGFGVPELSPTEAGMAGPDASMDFLFLKRAIHHSKGLHRV